MLSAARLLTPRPPLPADPRAEFLAAFPVSRETEARLARYENLLLERNQTLSLISGTTADIIWTRHFLDSAQLLRLIPEPGRPLVDIGTGAGFPGLVIAALRPDLPVVMIESRARRVEWLERVCAALGLTAARVVGLRLESVETFPARFISARAFAPLDRLLALSARFSTSDTLWLLPKGRSAWDEVNRLEGWRHLFHVEQSLTDPEAGVVTGTVAGPDATAGKPRGKRAERT